MHFQQSEPVFFLREFQTSEWASLLQKDLVKSKTFHYIMLAPCCILIYTYLSQFHLDIIKKWTIKYPKMCSKTDRKMQSSRILGTQIVIITLNDEIRTHFAWTHESVLTFAVIIDMARAQPITQHSWDFHTKKHWFHLWTLPKQNLSIFNRNNTKSTQEYIRLFISSFVNH